MENVSPNPSSLHIPESSIQAELLRIFVQRNKVIVPLGAMATVLIAALQIGIASTWAVLAFVLARGLSMGWCFWLCICAQRMGYVQAVELGLIRRTEWAMGWVGATWGAGGWLLTLGHAYSVHSVFLIVGIVSITALMLNTVSSLRWAIVIFYTSFWVVMLSRFGPWLVEPNGLLLPLGGVVLACVSIYFGHRMHSQLRQSIRLQLENQLLLEQVTALHIQEQQQKQQREELNVQLLQALETANLLASRDALTGLLNRRSYLERAHAEMSENKRQGSTAVIVMLDLDHFKKINDSFGHEMGDRVLVHTATVLRSTLRDEDVLARWGGEEFLLLLPRSMLGAVFAATQRLCLTLATTQPADWPRGLRVTASFGVAELRADLGLEASIALADAALYQAKELGRNRGVVAGHPEIV